MRDRAILNPKKDAVSFPAGARAGAGSFPALVPHPPRWWIPFGGTASTPGLAPRLLAAEAAPFSGEGSGMEVRAAKGVLMEKEPLASFSFSFSFSFASCSGRLASGATCTDRGAEALEEEIR